MIKNLGLIFFFWLMSHIWLSQNYWFISSCLQAHRQVLFCHPQWLAALCGAPWQTEQWWPLDQSVPSHHLSPRALGSAPRITQHADAHGTQSSSEPAPQVRALVRRSRWIQDWRLRTEAPAAHAASRDNRASLHWRHIHEWRHPATNRELLAA